MKKKTAGRILAGALTVTTALGLPIAFTGCPSPTGSTIPAIPEERGSHGNDTPIEFDFGKVIIRGENLYPSEWNGMTDKVIAALNADPENRNWPGWFGAVVKDVHDIHGHGLSIIVINTNEFANFKTTNFGDKIYININTKDLVNTMQQAFVGLAGGTPEICQVIPSARETVRMAKAPVDPSSSVSASLCRDYAAASTRAIVAQALGEKRLRQIDNMHRAMGLQKA